jgi:hypothetical protein
VIIPAFVLVDPVDARKHIKFSNALPANSLAAEWIRRSLPS